MPPDSSTGRRAGCAAAILAALCLAARGAPGQTYSRQMNPTGDPIGGGPGYRDIKSAAGADYVVSTRDELLGALGKASAGQLIYVKDDAEIDMTGRLNVAIPGGVTLASGRGRGGCLGGLIHSGSRHRDGSYAATFRAAGGKVRLTGLRLRGPSGDYGDHHCERLGVACCIRADQGDLEVDNCELWSWDKWAVYLATIGDSRVHHNYIHHTRRAGYGYGVWVAANGRALIEANLFDFNRHHIGSGAQHTGSYEARYNLCLYHDTNPSFDRHGAPDRAGNWTLIHHNTFRNTEVEAILLRGAPVGGAEFHHNWFYHADRKRAIDDGRAGGVRVKVHNNHYGPLKPEQLPVPRVRASPTAGAAPLAVTFDAAGSTDGEGGSIVSHEWTFGDEPGPVGVRAFGPKAAHVFHHPGWYPVGLRVGNDRGITGTTWVPIAVRPPQGGWWLTAWVKDSNRSDVAGFYRKQVLVDDAVVWEDDTAGDEGWQRLVLDVSRHVRGKEKVTLALRLRCDRQVTDPKTQLLEIFCYIDDVHLFGGSVVDGGFEAGGAWLYAETPRGAHWHGRQWSGEARSGKVCYDLEIPYGGTCPPAGSYCQVSQVVGVGPEPAPVAGKTR